MKKRAKALAIIVMLCALVGFLLRDSNEHVELTQYTVTSAKLPESFSGFKIVQLSDFHGAPFVDDIVSLVRAEKPDIIALTGDFITDGDDLMAVRELAQQRNRRDDIGVNLAAERDHGIILCIALDFAGRRF